MASNPSQESKSRANTSQEPPQPSPIIPDKEPSPNQPSSSSPRPTESAIQRHQFSHLHPSPIGQQVQPDPPSHLQRPLTIPLLFPRYPVYYFPVVPFALFSIADASRHITSVQGSENNQHQDPNFCYPAWYPSSSGHSDPSSRHAQVPQLPPPPPAYNIPGAYWHPLQTSAVLNRRGVIRPLENIRLTHKRLWEAQSAENVQLWNTVGQLQSEIAASETRTVKLEAEVSTLKEAAKVIKCAMENPPSRKPSKRSGSKRSIGTDGELRSKAQGGKHLQCEAQKEGSPIVSKRDNQEESSHPLSITRQEDQNVQPTITQSSGGVDGSGFKDKEDAYLEPDAVIPSVKDPNEDDSGKKVGMQ